jgi:hypothetical protein
MKKLLKKLLEELLERNDDSARSVSRGREEWVVVGRIEIDDVAPVVSSGRYPAKAVVGEVVPVTATVWREGHDALSATLVVRYHGQSYPRLAKAPVGAAPQVEAVPIAEVVGPSSKVRRPQLLSMSPGRTPDVLHGHFVPDAVGLWCWGLNSSNGLRRACLARTAIRS